MPPWAACATPSPLLLRNFFLISNLNLTWCNLRPVDITAFQVDKRYHETHGAWNSEEHIKQGTDILCQSITDIQKKFPTWSEEQQLKGGISAYNAGMGNVRTYEGMDVGTTHNDYANDVVARAKFFQRHGY
uniref:Lysozyme g n=1 Tax=Pavo cristatus TaxID=9049 RepID=A0A8C9EGN5_PAVCR